MPGCNICKFIGRESEGDEEAQRGGGDSEGDGTNKKRDGRRAAQQSS